MMRVFAASPCLSCSPTRRFSPACYSVQRRLLYPRGGPARPPRPRPACRFRGRRPRRRPTGNASSAGGSRRSPAGAAALISTATAASSGNRRVRVAALARGRARPADRELRGYSGSTGAPTEEGLRIDARTAYDFARERRTSRRRIVLYGKSLGRRSRCASPTERPVAGAHPRRALHLDRRCGGDRSTGSCRWHG